MTTEIIKKAQRLEEKLWDIAGQMGLQKTAGTTERLIRIMLGGIQEYAKNDPAVTRERVGEEYDQNSQAYELATVDEQCLASCFQAVYLCLDFEEKKPGSSWSFLCDAYHHSGRLEVAVMYAPYVEMCSSFPPLPPLGNMFAQLGKAGARKRHAPMVELREWAIKKYKVGKWPSANQAAHDLQDCVIEHGRTIGAALSKANAQRTIAEWLRKSV